MRDHRLEKIERNDQGLASNLSDACLPTDDLNDDGRSFFALVDAADTVVGYSGLETCGSDMLPRSLVILPEYRQSGLGRWLALLTVESAPMSADVYLATTSACGFFEKLGFEAVSRSELPLTVTSTRQLSGLCPASATVMKLKRPPT